MKGLIMLVSAVAVTYLMYRVGLALGLSDTGGLIGGVILVSFFGFAILFNKYFKKEAAKEEEIHELDIESNKRYIHYWFEEVPETMDYRHKITGQTVSHSRMYILIHSQRLPKLLNTIGINHEEVLRQAGHIS